MSMQFEEEYLKWKDQIDNLAKENVKIPNRPIDVVTAYSETLCVEADKDKDKLLAAGLNPDFIDEALSLSGALRYCQAVWMGDFMAKDGVQKDWRSELPDAYLLKKELLHHFKFAFRNMDDIQQKIKRIRQGSGHVDMIQDLLELSVLAEKYPEPLTKIGYDTELTTKARTVSNHMRELLAQVNGADATSAVKITRDKAFTLLINRTSEICKVGKYVFWNDPDRLTVYKSLQ